MKVVLDRREPYHRPNVMWYATEVQTSLVMYITSHNFKASLVCCYLRQLAVTQSTSHIKLLLQHMSYLPRTFLVESLRPFAFSITFLPQHTMSHLYFSLNFKGHLAFSNVLCGGKKKLQHLCHISRMSEFYSILTPTTT